jgi:hypothetical protein
MLKAFRLGPGVAWVGGPTQAGDRVGAADAAVAAVAVAGSGKVNNKSSPRLKNRHRVWSPPQCVFRAWKDAADFRGGRGVSVRQRRKSREFNLFCKGEIANAIWR